MEYSMGTIFHFLYGMCLFYKGMVKEYILGGWKSFVQKFKIEPSLTAKHISPQELEVGMHVHLAYKDPRSLGIQTNNRLTYTRFNPDEVEKYGVLLKGKITRVTNVGLYTNEKLVEFSYFKEDGTPRSILLLDYEIEKVIKIGN